MKLQLISRSLLSLIVLTLPRVSLAEPTYQLYDVYGKNLKEIKSSIKDKRPNNKDSGNEWHISWQYAFEEKNSACYLSKPIVNKKVIVILPRWIEDKEASEPTKLEWKRYISAIKTHQLGHISYASKAQAAILKAFKTLSSEKTCSALKVKANTLAKEILDDFYQQDREYEKNSVK